MPRKSNAFEQPGRRLGTGEEIIPCSKKDEPDSEYEYKSDNEDALDEEELVGEADIDEFLAQLEKEPSPGTVGEEVDHDDEAVKTDVQSDGALSHDDADWEGDDFFEVIDINNRCVRLPKAKLVDEVEDELEKNIINDPRFGLVGTRRLYTMAMIIHRTMGDNESESKVQDFSDEATRNLKTGRDTKFKMEECTEGTFIATHSEQGKIQYQEVSKAQLAEMGFIDTQKPCSCSVHTNRRKFAGDRWTNYGRTESRSGKKRGWYKYGEGKTLGDALGQEKAKRLE